MRPEDRLVIAKPGFKSVRPHLRRALVGTTALVVVVAGSAHAQEWTGDAAFGTDWTDAANWSTGEVPNAQDAEVVIDRGDVFLGTVYLGNTDIRVGSLTLTDADDQGSGVKLSKFSFGTPNLIFDSTSTAELVNNIDSGSKPVIDDSIDVVMKSDLKLSGTGSYEIASSITAQGDDRTLIVSPASVSMPLTPQARSSCQPVIASPVT